VSGDATGPIVQIRRRVRAGADEIFDLWTKPDLMVRWMSPYPGAVDCKASCDLRPGGAFSLVMSSGESRREVSGAYVQVDRPRKLVFTWMGPLTNNVNTLVTLELTPRGDETDLVLTTSVYRRRQFVKVIRAAGEISWTIWRTRFQKTLRY